jgi:hypothetical protein
LTASARVLLAAELSREAARATVRSCRSLYCSTRLATVTAIRAISGNATAIMPLARTGRSSHHCGRRPERVIGGRDACELTHPPSQEGLT